MDFKMPRMATNPPLPYSVYKQMADEEKYETLKDIANSAKQIADSAVADSIKAKKKANVATIISVISVIVSILTNLDKIISNVYFLNKSRPLKQRFIKMESILSTIATIDQSTFFNLFTSLFLLMNK